MIEGPDMRNTPAVIEDRINVGKLNDHQLYQRKRQMIHERRHSPTDRDKFNTYVGFKEHLKSVMANSVISKTLPVRFTTQKTTQSKHSQGSQQPLIRINETTQPQRVSSIDVVKNPQEIITTLRAMISLVLQSRFSAVTNISHSEDLFKMEWTNQLTSHVMPYGMVVVDAKSMSLVHLPNVFLSDQNKLIYAAKNDFHFVDFSEIMQALFCASEAVDQQLFPAGNLYYIMLYQGTLKEANAAGLVYEKFYYDTSIKLPIGTQTQNLFAAFYLRFLLLQDHSMHELSSLISSSQFILSRSSNVPQQLVQFLNALRDRQIVMQDRSQSCYVVDLVDILSDSILNQQPMQQQQYSLEEKVDQMVLNINHHRQISRQQRPSTAQLKKPPSVQTIEKMNRLSQGHIQQQYYSQRPPTAGPRFFTSNKPSDLIDLEFNQLLLQPNVTPQNVEKEIMRPVSSQYAMSLNFGDENLVNVLQLISSKTNSSSVFKSSKQGLRPQSAIKKKNSGPTPVQQQHSQQKLYGEQQNLRFVKKVRGMANPIVIRGTRVEE